MTPSDALKLTDPVIVNQMPWVALTTILVFVLGGAVAWLMFRSVSWYRTAVQRVQAWAMELVQAEVPKAISRELHNGFRVAIREDVRAEFLNFKGSMSHESQERLDRHEISEQAQLEVALATLKREIESQGHADCQSLHQKLTVHDKRLQRLDKRLQDMEKRAR